jgi:hypothetical protein
MAARMRRRKKTRVFLEDVAMEMMMMMDGGEEQLYIAPKEGSRSVGLSQVRTCLLNLPGAASTPLPWVAGRLRYRVRMHEQNGSRHESSAHT